MNSASFNYALHQLLGFKEYLEMAHLPHTRNPQHNQLHDGIPHCFRIHCFTQVTKVHLTLLPLITITMIIMIRVGKIAHDECLRHGGSSHAPFSPFNPPSHSSSPWHHWHHQQPCQHERATFINLYILMIGRYSALLREPAGRVGWNANLVGGRVDRCEWEPPRRGCHHVLDTVVVWQLLFRLITN